MQCPHIKQQHQVTKSLQGKKLYKDQCVRCFHEPTDTDGLFVCMKCFNGFCPKDRDTHTKDFNHNVFTNIVMTVKESSEKVEITKLAIGKQGGAVGGEEYDTSHSIYCASCKKRVPEQDKTLQAQVQSLINADSPFKKQSLVSWEVQILPCEHSLTLQQSPENKDLTKCSDCELSTNLWLCLTCGHTGCGRKYFDGTGGNNHGIDHFQKSGHPLVVKLGTVTAEGAASLYCYSCNNDVKDEFLKDHMETLGINFGSQKKTEKTVAEMNLELNLNFTLSKQLQNQKNDKIMYGPQFTGMNNIGNSCYLNSVVQMLNSLPEFRKQYYQKGQEHTNQCKSIPSECFYCQISKIAIGLNSGQYSEKQTKTRLINDKEVTQQFQKGIKPFDFKLLIADNNAEFLSNRQQDALEYAQWLFDQLDKKQSTYGQKTSQLFGYKQCNRLICQTCNNYKEVGQATNQWKFPVPPPSAQDLKQFDIYLQNQKDQDIRKAKSNQQPEYPVKFNDCLNFLRCGDSLQVKCGKCQKSTQFISKRYFNTTPKYLLTVANRFVIQKWVPKKLNALVEVPEKLDIAEFLLKNNKHEKGQKMVEEKKQQYSEDNVAMLQNMGYSVNACKRALIATKNNPQAAINWIMDNMDNNLDAPLEEANQGAPQFDSASVAQIQDIGGFSDIQAKIALLQMKNDVAQAIEWLFENPDVTPFLHLLESKAQSKAMQVEEGAQQYGSEYALKAVIVHLGKSVHSGHYVVYIKKNEEWTLFNDEKVTIPEKHILGKGYLYLYQRQ